MTLTTQNFDKVVGSFINDEIIKAYKEKPTVFDKVFNVGKMDRKTYEALHVSNTGEWEQTAEGQPYKIDTIVEGPRVTFTAEEFTKALRITQTMLEDDKEDILTSIPQLMGPGLRTAIEKSASTIFNTAFTEVGYDGVALFSDSHPLDNTVDSVDDNLATGALSSANVKLALIKLAKQRDHSGNLINAMGDTLIVPRALEYVAKTIINSTLDPVGDDSNNVNTVPQLKLIVWDYLDALMGGSDTAWFLMDSATCKGLQWKWRIMPTFGSDEEATVAAVIYKGRARWAKGHNNYRGIVGSTGL